MWRRKGRRGTLFQGIPGTVQGHLCGGLGRRGREKLFTNNVGPVIEDTTWMGRLKGREEGRGKEGVGCPEEEGMGNE
jgi:hypothetical protein